MARPYDRTPALFETAGRTPDTPCGFRLQAAETRHGGAVWLRYTIDSDQNNDKERS